MDRSFTLDVDKEPQSVAAGDAVLVAPHIQFGYQPEGSATMTTPALDTDYLIEHLFWRCLDVIADRDAARALAARG